MLHGERKTASLLIKASPRVTAIRSTRYWIYPVYNTATLSVLALYTAVILTLSRHHLYIRARNFLLFWWHHTRLSQNKAVDDVRKGWIGPTYKPVETLVVPGEIFIPQLLQH